MDLQLIASRARRAALLLCAGGLALPSLALAQDNPEEGFYEIPQEPSEALDDEQPPPVELTDGDLDPGDEGEPDEDSGGALLLAGKVGGGLPFSDLDPNVAGAFEVGYLFSRTGTSLGVLLDASYFVPQSEGEAVDARLSSAPEGSYRWHAWQKQLTFQPTVIYRLTSLSRVVVPYAGVGPRVYLLETVVDGDAGGVSFPISKEVSTKVGFGVPLGAELSLGPGGVIAEVLIQWGPLTHEITGDTHLASTTLWVGYRALL